MKNINIKTEVLNRIFSFPLDNLDLIRSKTFLKPLVKLMIRDFILETIEIDDDLSQELYNKYLERLNINTDEKKLNYLKNNLIDEDDLKRIAYSTHRANQYSLKLFADKSSEFFKKRKSQLDNYIYSILRIKNSDLSQELYLKLESNECEFADLVEKYSEGPEKNKKGLIGPISILKVHPKIKEVLQSSQKGIVNEPFRIDDYWIILKLENIIEANFDEKMKLLMSNELFEILLEKLTVEILDEIIKHRFSKKFLKT